MNAPGEKRVAEIRQQCEAASYLDGPTYEDMEYLLMRLREVEGERDNAIARFKLYYPDTDNLTLQQKLAQAERRLKEAEGERDAWIRNGHDALGRAEQAEQRVVGLEVALRRIGDWRAHKAQEHVEELRRFARTKDDNDFIDRFSGWLLMVMEIVDDAALTPLQPAPLVPPLPEPHTPTFCGEEP